MNNLEVIKNFCDKHNIRLDFTVTAYGIAKLGFHSAGTELWLEDFDLKNENAEDIIISKLIATFDIWDCARPFRNKIDYSFINKRRLFEIGLQPKLRIKKVIFNNPATIVEWFDGTKTVVKCQKDDVFDPEKGLAMAICKKVLGTNKSGSNFNDIFTKWIGTYEEPIHNEPQSPLNCKFIVLDNGGNIDITTGRIYNVVDGRFKDDSKSFFPLYDHRLENFSQLERYLSGAKADKDNVFYSFKPVKIKKMP